MKKTSMTPPQRTAALHALVARRVAAARQMQLAKAQYLRAEADFIEASSREEKARGGG
jgi:hypothetical protein